LKSSPASLCIIVIIEKAIIIETNIHQNSRREGSKPRIEIDTGKDIIQEGRVKTTIGDSGLRNFWTKKILGWGFPIPIFDFDKFRD
jgi:hypothetical protein